MIIKKVQIFIDRLYYRSNQVMYAIPAVYFNFIQVAK
jgi:hypothetical protein